MELEELEKEMSSLLDPGSSGSTAVKPATNHQSDSLGTVEATCEVAVQCAGGRTLSGDLCSKCSRHRGGAGGASSNSGSTRYGGSQQQGYQQPQFIVHNGGGGSDYPPSDDEENGVIEKFSPIVPLSVGGMLFITRLSTLRKYPDSMLASMFSGRHKLDRDSAGNYFIDTNGTYFSYLLDYLRHETLPPREVSLAVYCEAGYFGLPSLQEALTNTPEVGKMLVRERHRCQFPSYFAFRQQVIQLAMKQAVASKMGEVIIFAHRGESKNIHNNCVTETAHLKIGPWDSPVDEEVFIRTLHADYIEMGFSVNPFNKRRCKWYVQGATCQRCVFKLTFNFV